MSAVVCSETLAALEPSVRINSLLGQLPSKHKNSKARVAYIKYGSIILVSDQVEGKVLYLTIKPESLNEIHIDEDALVVELIAEHAEEIRFCEITVEKSDG